MLMPKLRHFRRPFWYRSKDNVAPAIEAGMICLAKDPLYALDPAWPGSKQYCAFPSLATALHCVDTSVNAAYAAGSVTELSMPCYYEIIQTTEAPTNIAFDLEREFSNDQCLDIKHSRALILRTFRRYLTSVLSQLAGQQIQLHPGVNCQFSQSFYTNKFSCHAVVYVPGFTWAMAEQVAALLHHIFLNLPADAPLGE
jgi:hypothetical protein